MTRPQSKRLFAAGALALAAGTIGPRASAPAGARHASAIDTVTAAPLLARAGVVPHDDGGDGGDGGDEGDGDDDTGSYRKGVKA